MIGLDNRSHAAYNAAQVGRLPCLVNANRRLKPKVTKDGYAIIPISKTRTPKHLAGGLGGLTFDKKPGEKVKQYADINVFIKNQGKPLGKYVF